MAQSCRESAQTSTKYIAASPKQAEEHHALLEAILSQQLNTIKKVLFFFALVASQNFFSTNDADFWIIQIIPINSSFDVFKSSLTSKASSKSRTLHCLEEKTELKKISSAKLSATDWNQLWAGFHHRAAVTSLNSVLTFRMVLPRIPPPYLPSPVMVCGVTLAHKPAHWFTPP